MNNTIKNVISQAINNCSNNVSVEELEKFSSFETTVETCNISELLSQKKQEVAELEKTINECEDCKAKQEAQAKAKAKAEEMFLGTLTASGKEVLSYLEGLQTLARGESLTLVGNIERIFKGYSKGGELTATANMAAYVAILVKEEKQEVINLLESITLKIDKIQCTSNVNDEKVIGLLNILLAIQDIY